MLAGLAPAGMAASLAAPDPDVASEFARDSPLEGNGFELPVPRAMHGPPEAIIAGFGCMPPSLDYLQLPKRNLGTEASPRAEREVRIHFPPAVSLQTFGSSRTVDLGAMAGRSIESLRADQTLPASAPAVNVAAGGSTSAVFVDPGRRAVQRSGRTELLH